MAQDTRDSKRSPRRGMKRGAGLDGRSAPASRKRCSLRVRPHDLCGIGPGGIDLALEHGPRRTEDHRVPACLGPGAMRGHGAAVTSPVPARMMPAVAFRDACYPPALSTDQAPPPEP